MKRVILSGISLLAALLVVSLVAGVAVTDSHGEVDMDQLVSQYNANVDEAPGSRHEPTRGRTGRTPGRWR